MSHAEPDRGTRAGQDGAAMLIEMMIATMVLVMVTLPVAGLFDVGTRVLGNGRQSVTAINVAAQQLNTDRAEAKQQFPPSLRASTTITVGNAVSYRVDQSWGWCSPGGGWQGNHGTAAVGASGYWVKVTVTWPGNTAGVTVGDALPTPVGYSGSEDTSTCPM